MSDLEHDSLDCLLGQASAADAARVRAAQAADPALAARAGEFGSLLDRLRGMHAPVPSEHLVVRLRSELRRQTELRAMVDAERARTRLRWRVIWRAACVAAIVVGGSRLQLSPWSRSSPGLTVADARWLPATVARVEGPKRPTNDAEAYVDTGLPMIGPPGGEGTFFTRVDAVTAGNGADSVLAWLGARNALDALRREFRQRFSREERRSVLAATGATPAREDRIQSLAGDVARQVEAVLADGDDPCALALGLRALLASGSSRFVGEHRLLVRRATDELLAKLSGDLPADVAVSLLAALTDVAVVSGGREGDTVRRHAERIAHATVGLSGDKRPTLLHRQAHVASLADAGYVMRFAPAFGASTGLCARARRLVLAHLRERLDVPVERERPELIAAMLYGFSDLVDLAALDTRLLLWGARQLRDDYLALLHYAWGQYPVRTGWASFQNDLRYLSTLPTPPDLADAACLLMTLATNFAAPGAADLMTARRG